ncbi:hypothetical protein pb186bvf_020797 [Paramecium bursaria]
MNRYATIYNYIRGVRMTTINDLKLIIFDSEKEEHFGMIDKEQYKNIKLFSKRQGFVRLVWKCQKEYDEELFKFKRQLADFKEQKFLINLEIFQRDQSIRFKIRLNLKTRIKIIMSGNI